MRNSLWTLTVKEKTLLHLFDFFPPQRTFEKSFKITQEGVAEAIGIMRSAVPRTMKELISGGLVTDELCHVKGLKRRRKCYLLTTEGYRETKKMVNRLKDVRIEIVLGEGEKEAQQVPIGKCQEVIGFKVGLIDIVRVLEKYGHLDVSYLEKRTKGGEKAEIEKKKAPKKPKRNIPSVRYFFGRESELREISSAFEKGSQFVVVYGLAGIGKTTLASKYVEKNVSNDSIFWHRFYSWDDIRTILLELGEHLEDRGITGICKDINERTNVYPLLVHPIIKNLADTEVFFVMDDFHNAGDDIVELMVMLKNEAKRLKGARFLLLSREHRPFFDVRDTLLSKMIIEMELSGLDEDSVLELYKAASDENVSKEDLGTLIEVSKGHPLAVELIAARRTPGGDLGSLSDMDGFMENEIFSQLSIPEKNLLLLVSVARIPADVDCLLFERTLARKNDGVVLIPSVGESLFGGDTLHSLLVKHLVLRENRKLFAHDIVCEFFSKWPSLKIKRAVHMRWASYLFSILKKNTGPNTDTEPGRREAIKYLTKDDEDILLALFHHLREAAKTTLLAPAILRFRSSLPKVFRQEELVRIFEGDHLNDLSKRDRGVVLALLGDLHYRIGSMDVAIKYYYRSQTDRFHEIIDGIENDDTRKGKGTSKRDDVLGAVTGMREIFSLVEQHQEPLGISDIRDTLIIGLKTGRFLMKKGMWEEGELLLKEGFKIADRYGLTEIKADYLAAVGWIYHHLGELESSRKYYDECLDTLIDHHDIPGAIRKNLALGRACAREKDLEKAIRYFEMCMNYFENKDPDHHSGEVVTHIGDHYLKMLFSTYMGE